MYVYYNYNLGRGLVGGVYVYYNYYLGKGLVGGVYVYYNYNLGKGLVVGVYVYYNYKLGKGLVGGVYVYYNYNFGKGLIGSLYVYYNYNFGKGFARIQLQLREGIGMWYVCLQSTVNSCSTFQTQVISFKKKIITSSVSGDFLQEKNHYIISLCAGKELCFVLVSTGTARCF